jgi:hypothetical protein
MPAGLYGSPEIGESRRRGSDYPVQVNFIIPARNSRFYAIPLVGYVARVVLLVPHVFVLAVLGLVVMVVQLFLWVPVLIAGRYPRWGYTVVGNYLRWTVRVSAFLFGLTDRYPPFRLGD